MGSERVIVVGAGIGGMTAAIDLARQGFDVTVLERALTPGGKMREVPIGHLCVDSGPTVLTMRDVFDDLFAACGADFASVVPLTPLTILARHAWTETQRFDLHADLERTVDAVGDFAGSADARRYRAFARDAGDIYRTLKDTFLNASRPNPVSLAQRIGLHRPGALLAIRPFDTLWRALGSYFHDPRLRQLFARYATYSGSSPFLAPATLMLIAHVEQEGVWAVDGGMQRLADALARLAAQQGCTLRYASDVKTVETRHGRVRGVALASGERIEADAVVLNADAAGIAAGLLGADISNTADAIELKSRSLSAITWSMVAPARGFPLHRHNVFFGPDYAEEFDALFRHRRLPKQPTIYVCAQDRLDGQRDLTADSERLLVLVNAPATADTHPISAEEIATCETQTFNFLAHCGLNIRRTAQTTVVSTPTDFNRMFPGTGGALYGRATHGWAASFQRPHAQTRISGLYLAGGSVHPGAGVPMAALSGRLAARQLIADRPSTPAYRKAGISGGMSMR